MQNYFSEINEELCFKYFYDVRDIIYPELGGLAYIAFISASDAGKAFSVSVPEEKDGQHVSAALILYETLNGAEPPGPEYLYVSKNVRYFKFQLFPQNLLLMDFIETKTGPLSGCTVEVSPENPYLTVYENGVYSKDMKSLFYIFSPDKYNDGYFEVPACTERVKNHAAAGLKGLRRLFVPESVEIIERCAFIYCHELAEADIRAKVIENNAFEMCGSLVSLRLSGKVTGSRSFAECRALRNIELSGTETIGDYAFIHCGSLKCIRLPETLHKIGCGAFAAAGIKRLTIHRGIREVGRRILSSPDRTGDCLEIYLKGGAPTFAYQSQPACDGTVITARSSETEEILFEFVMLGNIGKVFTKHGVDFSGYDKIFRYDSHYKSFSSEQRTLAAIYRLQYPIGLDGQDIEFFKNYASKNAEFALWEMISDNKAGAGEIAEHPFLRFVDDERLAQLIDETAKNGKTEVTAALMQKLHERKGDQMLPEEKNERDNL